MRKSGRQFTYTATLNFLGGLPDSLVSNGAVLFYKSLGYSNTFVGILGLLYLPYATVTFWAPLLDGFFRKRTLISCFGFTLAFLFGALAVSIARWGEDIAITLTIVVSISLAGASFQSVGIRGFLLHALSKEQLPILSAMSVASNRVGIVVGSSLLVAGAALIGTHYNNIRLTWILVFAGIAVIMLLGTILHRLYLPHPVTDVVERTKPTAEIYREVVLAVKNIPNLAVIVSFFLIYRFGEALLVRMIVPFFMDQTQMGGLGFSVGATAFMTGSAGFAFTIIGGMLGGWIIRRVSLRRAMLPFSLCMFLPHLAYVYLAATQPAGVVVIHLGQMSLPLNPIVQLCICLEFFGYGVGYSGSTYLQFLVCRGRYRASLYAFTNALVSVGWLVPLTLSGWLQSRLGYRGLFLASIAAAVPGIFCIHWLPLARLETALAHERDAASI